jgi:hypothetical protein
MNRSLVQRFLSLLSHTVTKEYINRWMSNPNETYLDFLRFFVQKYGQSSEPQREENLNSMKADRIVRIGV